MIRTTCTSCTARLSFPDSVAGTAVQCPKCEEWFDVPLSAVSVDHSAEPKTVRVFIGRDHNWHDEAWAWFWIAMALPILFAFIFVFELLPKVLFGK